MQRQVSVSCTAAHGSGGGFNWGRRLVAEQVEACNVVGFEVFEFLGLALPALLQLAVFHHVFLQGRLGCVELGCSNGTSCLYLGDPLGGLLDLIGRFGDLSLPGGHQCCALLSSRLARLNGAAERLEPLLEAGTYLLDHHVAKVSTNISLLEATAGQGAAQRVVQLHALDEGLELLEVLGEVLGAALDDGGEAAAHDGLQGRLLSFGSVEVDIALRLCLSAFFQRCLGCFQSLRQFLQGRLCCGGGLQSLCHCSCLRLFLSCQFRALLLAFIHLLGHSGQVLIHLGDHTFDGLADHRDHGALSEVSVFFGSFECLGSGNRQHVLHMDRQVARLQSLEDALAIGVHLGLLCRRGRLGSLGTGALGSGGGSLGDHFGRYRWVGG
mmetsp:Transcript_78313/g.162700  ORF Transcript_78313/g.162700 Transcript_78313/m.162700 type:complete len:382 (+) Transcript_78313:318-1463(+)